MISDFLNSDTLTFNDLIRLIYEILRNPRKLKLPVLGHDIWFQFFLDLMWKFFLFSYF